jgi:hypothetical protein
VKSAVSIALRKGDEASRHATKIDISPEHVSEAIQYRTFDRTLWV